MRDGAPDQVMTTLYRWRPLVQSWSPAGDLLADDIPLISGSVSYDVASRGVPEQATLVVPRYSVVGVDKYDWLPHDDTNHPLAPYGQTLTIAGVVTSTVMGTEWTTPLARVRIQSWEEDEEGSITVAGVGMLQLAADDELYIAETPSEGDTLLGELARLLPAGLSVSIDPGVEDRPVVAGTQWTGSRLDVLYDIVDALPARLRTDADGTVLVLPPLEETPTTPLARYRDGEPGAKVTDSTGATHDMPTLVSAPRADTREKVINSVTVLSQVTSASGSTASVVIEQTDGPFAISTYGRVTESWSSDQITTTEQAEAAGRERLAKGLRPARTVAVEIAPDPRIEPDDPVTVLRGGAQGIGYVLGQSIDLIAADATSLTVSITGELFVEEPTPLPWPVPTPNLLAAPVAGPATRRL